MWCLLFVAFPQLVSVLSGLTQFTPCPDAGDRTPATDLEKCFSIVTELAGGMIFGTPEPTFLSYKLTFLSLKWTFLRYPGGYSLVDVNGGERRLGASPEIHPLWITIQIV